jgi:hypothetical protein
MAMRKILIALPLLLCAAPALAQEAPPGIPPELTDPATAHRLAGTMQALSQALLNIRVGEIRAGLEGRDPTPLERNVTLHDLARMKDPNFDRHYQEQVASVGPQLERSMTAMQRTLPKVMDDLKDVQRSLERAVSNLPDPTYPER